MSDIVIRELSGHSGCKVLLCRGDQKRLFVRKISSSLEYNIRLKKQCIKQKLFIKEGVFSPAVFGFGYIGSLFYFDMEFLSCSSLAEDIKFMRVQDIKKFIKLLFKMLPVENSTYDANANTVFYNKISDLEKRISSKNENISCAFRLLKAFDFSSVHKSYCCGDLTLENILISSDGHVYLIDFLDSFYNSWMIDIAKILQDLELKWSYRHQNLDFNSDMRLWIGREALVNSVLELDGGKIYLLSIYHLLLLNVLRIFPYARDQVAHDFVLRSVAYLINVIGDFEVEN